MVVIPFDTSSKVSCINLSLVLSNALVASSKSNIYGLFKIALAIAILYFYPPLN